MAIHGSFLSGPIPNMAAGLAELNYIGPLFAARFEAIGIGTFNDLVDEFKENTDWENRNIMNAVFMNPQSHARGGPVGSGCLGRGSRRRNAAGVRGGNRYYVRQVNAFGFNAIVVWFIKKARLHPGSAVFQDIVNYRLPDLKLMRNYRSAYPMQCA